MASLDLKVTARTFNASAELDGRVLRVALSGTADLVVREQIEEFLRALHATAGARRVERVEVDFRKLEFMNSSCFKSFIEWINAVQESPPEKHYRIKLLSSSTMLWQRRSMHALKCFAADLVDVET